MAKRVAILTVLLWVVLYGGQWLVRTLVDLAGAHMVDHWWVLALVVAVPVLVASWLVGRWMDVTGRRLALASVIVLLVVYAAASMAGSAVSMLSLRSLDNEAALAVFYLLVAVATTGSSWLVSSLVATSPAHT